MHSRRFCTLLLGIWIAGSVLVAWVATNNLKTVEPHARSTVRRVEEKVHRAGGAERVSALLKYHSAELNRDYFEGWELFQLGMGLLLGLVLLFATNGNKVVLGAWALMYLMVVVQHLALTPRIIDVGRGLDLAGMDEFLDERRIFSRLHAAYGWTEITKGVGALVLGLRLLWSSKPASGRRRRRRDLDEVNDADHSHVNG
ncbi:MAG: hypothetical protein R2762_21165 [Bryobacteraceae bacterium]